MITTCAHCGNCYGASSKEQANEPERFCPVCSLRHQLTGTQAEIETYRLREWACYQALGYTEPTDEALPHLIESMMGLKARLQDSLDSIERATGFHPGTEPLATWVERMAKERGVAQKACAEMRSELGRIKVKPWAHVITQEDRESIGRILSSTDCGSSYVPRADVDQLKAQVKSLVEALREIRDLCQITGLIPERAWVISVELAQQALAHAKELGLGTKDEIAKQINEALTHAK